MMEFFLSGSLPLIDFVICDVMSDMANKLLSLSLSYFVFGSRIGFWVRVGWGLSAVNARGVAYALERWLLDNPKFR